MITFRLAVAAITASIFYGSSAAFAQGYTPPDIELQKEKMQAFSMIEGQWHGEGWMIGPDRQKREFAQTEKVAYALDGLIMTIHGKGAAKDDPSTVYFEAMATISYNEKTEEYRIHSYTGGHVGDYAIIPTETGFEWSIPMTSYVATIDGDTWTETGARKLPDGNEFKFIEFTVMRQD